MATPKTTDLEYKTFEFKVRDRVFHIVNDAEDTLISETLDVQSTWEPWQINLYEILLANRRVCLDIGANIGTSALAMSVFNPKGSIYSFEPIKYVYDMLVRNIKESKLLNIHPINYGLFDSSKKETISINRHNLAASSIVGPNPENSIDAEHQNELQFTVEVNLVELDKWLAESGINEIDFVKVDVEGYELEVISGGKTVFNQNNAPVSIFEFAIPPQRNSREDHFPKKPKDFDFLEKLKTIYENILLICRTGELVRVRDYAHIRAMMMNGYPVEDLLCFNGDVPEISNIITETFEFTPPLGVNYFVVGSSSVAILNRHEDGWSGLTNDISGTRSAIVVNTQEAKTLSIHFKDIFSKHAKHASGEVMACFGDEVRFVNVLDKNAVLEFKLTPGHNIVFLESEFELNGPDYLGNPVDTRQIGFNFNVYIE